MTVTFIGHSDTPESTKIALKKEIEKLITESDADLFYIGTHGNFDAMAKKCVMELQKNHPDINYFSILAYLPQKNDEYTDYSKTIYPSGIESVPKKNCNNQKKLLDDRKFRCSNLLCEKPFQ